jgi:hypothetical protein
MHIGRGEAAARRAGWPALPSRRSGTGSRPLLGVSCLYVLVPEDHRTTGLLLKVVAQTSRWIAPVLSVGGLIMARRLLLNLKQFTERQLRTGQAPD